MNEIRDIELQSSNEYYSAVFICKDGKVYDIVIYRNVERNIGWETVDVINVQYRGDEVNDADLISLIQEQLSDVSLL